MLSFPLILIMFLPVLIFLGIAAALSLVEDTVNQTGENHEIIIG